jgi:tripartite-type tricarboxylate transporter receptor subunit TctC
MNFNPSFTKNRSVTSQLLLVTSANATNGTLYEKLSFNFIRDIAPIAATTRSPLVLEVHPAFSPSSLTEFTPMRRPILARSPWRRLEPPRYLT